MTQALVSLLTALADDELIIGHRHSEWTGHAPHIEEDVAFSSIAQDEIGHASALYALAAEIGEAGDADALALGRARSAYRHAILCERPNQDWSYTLARHWLYDEADDIRLEVLETSAHEPLAQLATKMRREERWHLLHATTWMQRVSSGPLEGRIKLADAVARAFADTRGLFETLDEEAEAVSRGILPVPMDEQRRRFDERITATLDRLGLQVDGPGDHSLHAEFVASSSGDLLESAAGPAPRGAGNGTGGRRGNHSDAFGDLWDVMTRTYREHPGARW